MSELKKKLDGARPHCLPRALVLINPGNPTGTLNVYLFVITCNNSNEDDDDDDDGNDNKISLFTLDIVFISTQRAKEVVSDSPGLVDFAIGLVNSVFNLPDGQVMFYEEFE